MKASPLLGSLVLLSASACFVDAIGLGDGSGAGAGDPTTTSGGGTTETGPGSTTTNAGGGGPGGAGGSGVTTTGGGGGSGPGCTIDGAIDPTEACEDGNLTAGDGCDPTCQIEATCANGAAEGGEPCDDGTVCDDSCLGNCQGGTLLTAGATVSGSPNGGVAAFPSCAEPTGAMRVYRIETSPHPEGVVVYVSDAGTSFDPVLWLARDCQDVWGCIDFWSPDAETRGLITGILPPSTHLIAAVADKDGNDPTFEIYYRTFRYFDEFQQDPAGWSLGEWDSDGSGLNTWDDPSGTAAVSPDIYVGGITTIRVAFPYRISPLAAAEVSASFDGGAFTVVKTLPQGPNMSFPTLDGTFTLPRPPGAANMRLRFEYFGTSQGIVIDRLEVGADVPAPTF